MGDQIFKRVGTFYSGHSGVSQIEPDGCHFFPGLPVLVMAAVFDFIVFDQCMGDFAEAVTANRPGLINRRVNPVCRVGYLTRFQS